MAQTEFNQLSFDDPLQNYDAPTYEDRLAEALAERTVGCMRLIPYAEISPDASVMAAVRAMSGLGISSLLVVKDFRLVGIITERDILDRACEQFDRINSRCVSEFMTSHPVVLREEDPVGAALAAIAVSGHRHVPVLNCHEQVVGVVSPRRVFRFLHDIMYAAR